MEREPLQRLIERSIKNKVIDGHAIDQDGSNVLIVGDNIHYCSDEGARAFLTSRSERPVACPQNRTEPHDEDESPDPGAGAAQRPDPADAQRMPDDGSPATEGGTPTNRDERAAPSDNVHPQSDKRPPSNERPPSNARSAHGDDRRPVELSSRGPAAPQEADANLESGFGRRPANGATA